MMLGLLAFMVATVGAADPQATCGRPVRLDRQGGPLQGFPIDNQFQNGSCFAHVASLVMYAYEKSRGVEHPRIISPASISLAYAQRLNAENINDGGDLCDAINGYLEYGGCYTTELSETIGKNLPLRELTDNLLEHYRSFRTYLSLADNQAESRRKLDLAIGRAIYLLTGDASALRPAASSPPPASEFDLEASFLSEVQGHTPEYWKALRNAPQAAASVAQCMADTGVESARVPSVDTIAPVLSQSDSIKFLRTVLENHCAKAADPVFADARCREVSDASAGARSPYDLSEIDHLLDEDRPAPLALSGAFLKTGTADIKHDHALAIVGRRTAADGQCEYLIRNSWGRNCKNYAPRFQKACGMGQLWLKKTDLTGAYVMGELGQPN